MDLGPIGSGPLRVGILSDTHGWVDPQVLEVVSTCDLAVHGGDIGNGAVLGQLRPRQGAVWAVSGNNDVQAKWPESDRDLLARLPARVTLPLPGGLLVVVHGHQTQVRGRHDRLRRRFPEARALVYGHSHRCVLDTDIRPWVLNPGAAGRTRTYGGPSCLVLTADVAVWTLELHRFAPPASPGSRPRTHLSHPSTKS